MTPERAQQLYEAVQLLRDFRKEAAIIAPAATVVSPVVGAAAGLVVEFEPAAEAVLSLFFEAVSAFDTHQGDFAAAKAQMAERSRSLWQSVADERGGGG